MSIESSPNIAMVGMYGGMWREFNPGCFMIGLKTKEELRVRMPEANIDVFSIDNSSQGKGIETVRLQGLDLNFFGRDEQLDFLEETVSGYDAVVMGGDIIWGGDDVIEDNDIFFLNSPAFRERKRPSVLFNSVHTFYDDESIDAKKDMFRGAIERSVYAAVRTGAIKRRLGGIGLTGVEYVPDPVLDVDMRTMEKHELFLPTERDKPILGVSIREKLADVCMSALGEIDTDELDVVVFPFSRQYKNLETVMKVQDEFGDKFKYKTDYLDPVKTYQFVGELDMFLSDTYHGVIASIIHDKPFVSLDVEPEHTSRKQQLLEAVGVDQGYNIRLSGNLDVPARAEDTVTLRDAMPELLTRPVTYSAEVIRSVRSRIQAHYDRMADHIMESV